MKLAFLTLLLAMLLIAGCSDSSIPPERMASPEADDQRTITISDQVFRNADFSFAEAASGKISMAATAFGEVALNTDNVASIVSRVEGVLTEDRKQLGDRVEEGEALAVIESRSLAQSIVEYLQTERERRFATAEFNREKALFEKKLTSSQEYYEAEQAYHKALIAHAAALQPLELLNFTERQLHGYLSNPEKANLTKFEVRSPISGVVTRKSLIKGEAVSDDAQLFVVAELSEVWVDFQVPLSSISGIQQGDRVSVSSSGGDVESYADVKYVSPIANESSRAVPVRAAMENSDGLWRPGSPVVVGFSRKQTVADIVIPTEALLDFEGGFAVFVRKGARSFELREVIPGDRDDSQVAILDGLERGETVVSANAYLLKSQWMMQPEA